jgi:hypothetical protein
MEELVCCLQKLRLAGSRITHGRQIHKKLQEGPLPDRPPKSYAAYGVCDPIDCRVAFIPRGQPQGVTGVAQAVFCFFGGGGSLLPKSFFTQVGKKYILLLMALKCA